jgi:hypothetical protein
MIKPTLNQIFSFGLCILFVSTSWGCASTHRTTKTETTVTYGDGTPGNRGNVRTATKVDQPDSVVIEKSETTTETTDTKTEHHGVLSSTFHAIGYVISIPFIIIGGVFRTIFGG